MNYAISMNILQCLYKTSAEEPCLLLCEPLLPLKVVPEIATLHILHNLIQILFILERILDIHSELALNLFQDLKLTNHRSDAIFLHYPSFKHFFDSKLFIF